MHNYFKLKSNAKKTLVKASKYAKQVAVNTVKREMIRSKKAGKHPKMFANLDF